MNYLNQISIFDYQKRNDWLGIAGLHKAAGGSFEEFHQWSMQDPEKYKGEQDCRNAWSIEPTESRDEAIRRLRAIAGEHNSASSEKQSSKQATTSIPKTSLLTLPEFKFKTAIDDAVSVIQTIHPDGLMMFAHSTKEKINTEGFLAGFGDSTQTEEMLIQVVYQEPCEDGLFWLLNEVAGLEPNQHASIRNDMISSYEWGLIESDEQSLDEQYTLLMELKLPLFAAVYSGGKSIHAFVHIGASNAEEYAERMLKLYEYAEANGLKPDKACKSLSRWCRFPFAKRGEKRQYPVIVNKEYMTYEQWAAQIAIAPLEAIPKAHDDKKDGKPLLRYHHIQELIAKPQYWGQIRFNEMSHGFEISGFKWIKKVGGVDEIEVLADELRAFLHRKYSGTDHGQVVRHLHKIGADNVYNPIKEKLELIKWDGVDRIERLCNTLSPLDDFARSLIRKWLIQCVAMLYNDHSQYGAEGVLTLQGPEGIGKTSFFRSLVPEIAWFYEGATIDLENKDSIRRATSRWICEIGECDYTTKKKQTNLKAFITQNEDRDRREYERHEIKYPRKSSFCATVNNEEFLYDGENRRWWVFPITQVDLAALRELHKEVWQLWAQVKGLWKESSQAFRLNAAEQQQLALRNRKFQTPLVYQELIEEFFDWESDKDLWEEYSPKRLRDMLEIKNDDVRLGKSLTRIIKIRQLDYRTLNGYRIVRLPPPRVQ